MKLKIREEKKPISSAFDFARHLHELGQKEKVPAGATSALWFRGQSDMKYGLIPSIGRDIIDGGLYGLHKGIIKKELVKKAKVKLRWEDVSKALINNKWAKEINSEEVRVTADITLQDGFKDKIQMSKIFRVDCSKILSILKHVHDEAFYQNESVLVQRFKRDAYPFVQRLLTDWEAITLGQHHRLPTRLLDWTSNSLVALFFAADKHKDADGAVFVYRPRMDAWKYHISMFEGQNPRNTIAPNPLNVKGIKIVFPMLIANRLITQSGGFTIQDPLVDLMGMKNEDFEARDLDIFEISKWILPKENKWKVLDELHRVSINRKTLFPDLDGVGYGLWKQESFRQVIGR